MKEIQIIIEELERENKSLRNENYWLRTERGLLRGMTTKRQKELEAHEEAIRRFHMG